MKVALIAHDKKKDALITFVKINETSFKEFELCSTGTTGQKIMAETGLKIKRYHSGPLGGDQQIGAMLPTGQVEAIFFFRDPLTAQPHEPDVNALLRLCDVYDIPVATNAGTATAVLNFLNEKRSEQL